MDPSADIAAWTAVGIAFVAVAVAVLSIIVSLKLYARGQRDARRERQHSHDIETLTKLLEIMSGPSSLSPNVVMPIAYMSSLIDTLSLDARSRIQDFNDDLLNESHPEVIKKAEEIRWELQEAIAEIVSG